jgi:hypothetical protein
MIVIATIEVSDVGIRIVTSRVGMEEVVGTRGIEGGTETVIEATEEAAMTAGIAT